MNKFLNFIKFIPNLSTFSVSEWKTARPVLCLRTGWASFHVV